MPRYCDFSGLDWMFELSVASDLVYLLPAVRLQALEDVAYFHVELWRAPPSVYTGVLTPPRRSLVSYKMSPKVGRDSHTR